MRPVHVWRVFFPASTTDAYANDSRERKETTAALSKHLFVRHDLERHIPGEVRGKHEFQYEAAAARNTSWGWSKVLGGRA